MANVSRPLIALLVGTVAVFALWIVALKPSASTSPGGGHGLGVYQSAIDKAHKAVANSNRASIAPGAAPTAPSAAAAAGAGAPAAAAAPVAPAPRHRFDAVSRALRHGKVLALSFFNPSGSDDRAVRRELASVPTRGGRVVKLAVPLSELARYALVTSQVPVTSTPTLVLIDSDRQASTIVGFADRFEISQRVSEALAVK